MITSETLHHVTLLTGHVAHTRRTDVRDDVIALLRPIVAAGVARIPGPIEWYLITPSPGPGWSIFSVSPTTDPEAPDYVTCTACWDERAAPAAWATTGQHQPPPPAPWLAVALGPAFPSVGLNAASMLGDLERCVFWTLADTGCAILVE